MRRTHILALLILLLTVFAAGTSQAITVAVSPGTITAGQSSTITIGSTFSGIPACTLDVSFGDGSSSSVGLGTCTSIIGATFVYSCTATVGHTYTSPGLKTIQVTHNPACSLLPAPPDPARTALTVNCPPLAVTTSASLPPSRAGEAYSAQVQASGGQAPYAYSIIGGSLPAGLSLSPSGFISGVPSIAGSYSFEIRVSDSCPAGSNSIQQTFTIVVSPPAPCSPLSIVTPSALPDARVGNPYAAQLQASGGQAPYTFSAPAEALPPGLNITAAGTITGMPSTAGTYQFPVIVADTCPAGPQTANKKFSIDIRPQPSLVTVTPVPSFFSIPRGQGSSAGVTHQFTGSPSTNDRIISPSGSFSVGNEIIDINAASLSALIRSGKGQVAETIIIPVRVIERALQRGTNRFTYERIFSDGGISAVSIINFTITTDAGAAFDIKRIGLSFDKGKAEATVERNHGNLRAYADIRFTGSGLLQGYWEVDGRILSTVNQHLKYGASVILQTPGIPPLPTFEPGSHSLRFVITNPEPAMALPSLVYFVTQDDAAGKPADLKLLSPVKDAAINYGPAYFEWEKPEKASFFLVQYFDRTDAGPFFSAYTNSPSYAVPDIILKKHFSPGSKYFWKVTGFDSGNNLIAESLFRDFSLR
ncbi:MAG: putative Ig domain-containing protein [Nitrospirae bacterium]|nr:putative Ig domain-containing protein [Nitrospirota bacterium]